jgi:hypothetical protein
MPRFNPFSVYMRSVMGKVALGQVFLWVLWFYPVSFHQCSILIFILILIISESQVHVAEPSKTREFFQILGAMDNRIEKMFKLLLWLSMLFVLACCCEDYVPSLHYELASWYCGFH